MCMRCKNTSLLQTHRQLHTLPQQRLVVCRNAMKGALSGIPCAQLCQDARHQARVDIYIHAVRLQCFQVCRRAPKRSASMFHTWLHIIVLRCEARLLWLSIHLLLDLPCYIGVCVQDRSRVHA